MSLRPWMTRRFLLALVAMAILFALLVAATLRLLSSENATADYITEDMVWLSSQGQYEAVRFADAVRGYGQGEVARDEVQLLLDLLSSRIAVLEQGEPHRQLQGLGYSGQLDEFRLTVDGAHGVLQALQPDDGSAVATLHEEALELAASLRDVANAALFSKRQRDAAIREQRRHTLFEVLATLVATMAAGLLLAGILVGEHGKMVRAEAALERERQVSRLHRAFISVVSHQFRTPLAIIDASAQRMVRRGSLMSEDEIASRAEKIRAACLRLTRLMESTLNAARLEEGEIALNLRSCDLEELLRGVWDSQPEQDQRRIALEIENLPRAIEADTTLLEQAVQNLISNALKYSPAGSSVKVHAARVGSDIVIEVTDQGVGVPEDELGSLFRRFYRARTAEGIPGTGIGLSFAAQIMDLHRGRIEVNSVEGKGSTFTLRFPFRRPAPEASEAPILNTEVIAGP
ncbi:sensor histidine kinase [Devosia albogilva]|uniref:histidine kinase n=1 Tax=Devosia albogilva TaxID=429726 RepID=A0ABW5QKY6_9HYPH